MIERQLAAQFALSGAHLGQVQLVQYPAFGVENSSQNMGRKGFAGAVLPAKGIAHVAIDHGGPKFGPGRSDKAHLQAQSGTACPQARGEGIGPIITSTAGDRQPVRCGEKDQYIAGKGIGQFDLFGAGVRGLHRLDDHVGAVGLGAVCMGGIGRIAPIHTRAGLAIFLSSRPLASSKDGRSVPSRLPNTASEMAMVPGRAYGLAPGFSVPRQRNQEMGRQQPHRLAQDDHRPFAGGGGCTAPVQDLGRTRHRLCRPVPAQIARRDRSGRVVTVDLPR